MIEILDKDLLTESDEKLPMRSSRHIFVAHQIRLHQIRTNSLVIQEHEQQENPSVMEILDVLKNMSQNELGDINSIEELQELLGGYDKIQPLLEVIRQISDQETQKQEGSDQKQSEILVNSQPEEKEEEPPQPEEAQPLLNEISMNEINALLQQLQQDGLSQAEVQDLISRENPEVYKELLKFLEAQG